MMAKVGKNLTTIRLKIIGFEFPQRTKISAAHEAISVVSALSSEVPILSAMVKDVIS